MAAPPATRILTAVAPDTVERVRRILVGHDLRIVARLAEARDTLREDDLGLVFVGARFDDSRMFDLIELIRKDVEKKKIPIVVAIVTPTHLSKNSIAGLGHSVKIFGATVFVNLNDFPDDAVGNAHVRLIVDAVILPPEAVQELAPPTLGDASDKDLCLDCVSLVGAPVTTEAPMNLRFVKGTDGRKVFQCATCHAVWIRGPHGWSRSPD